MASAITPHATDDFWSKPENIDEYLARKLRLGSTSMVLGAGASAGFNLPDWKKLVNTIKVDCGEPASTAQINLEQEADRLFLSYFSSDQIAFANAVRRALYAEAKQDANFLLKSDLLQAIAAFLTNSIKGKSGALVTFNFDDIVESYLTLLGFVVRSEASMPAWTTSADMVVFHPNGLLPLDSEVGTTPIVFTLTDFAEITGSESNSWNQTLHSIWSTTFPVFIGLSGDDIRLRASLGSIRKVHPATLNERSLYWGVRPTLKNEPSHTVEVWRKLGVVPRFVSRYEDIPTWLLSICKRAALIRV
jgi:SIR2-like domain